MSKVKKKLIAIVQARMGSSRLPGKVLMTILDKPVLWHITNRLKQVDKIDDVVIATSYLKRDDRIEEFCEEYEIACFRGNDADVLDRFYKASFEYGALHLIRVFGDCPLIDSDLITQVIEYYFQNKLNYCSVATGSGLESDMYYGQYPEGLDAEILSFSALEKAWKEADGILYREHVTPYIWKHPTKFKTGLYRNNGKAIGDMRWTMDDMKDFELIKCIYEALYPEKPEFNLNDVIELMDKQPNMFIKEKEAQWA